MKLSWKEILRPTAVLFVICVAVAAALAGTNLLTEERIAQQAVATAEESRKVVLPGAEEFQAQEDGAYYTGSAGGQLVGYVFETEASGYGGKDIFLRNLWCSVRPWSVILLIVCFTLLL